MNLLYKSMSFLRLAEVWLKSDLLNASSFAGSVKSELLFSASLLPSCRSAEARWCPHLQMIPSYNHEISVWMALQISYRSFDKNTNFSSLRKLIDLWLHIQISSLFAIGTMSEMSLT